MVDMMAQLPIDNISKKLAPELLTAIFQFLPYDDLKNALLVCRWVEKEENIARMRNCPDVTI